VCEEPSKAQNVKPKEEEIKKGQGFDKKFKKKKKKQLST